MLAQPRAAIREISERGRTAVLVGGTGFYLRGLLEGLSPGPARNDTLRARLLRNGNESVPGSLHRILARLDPASAARIHPNDKNKTMRALEVRLLEGAPLSSMFERGRAALSGFLPVKIGLDPPRDLLYARLNERARRMFDPADLLRLKFASLLAAGVPRECEALRIAGLSNRRSKCWKDESPGSRPWSPRNRKLVATLNAS